jgi:multidrug efflux pump subunit AcrA (membrane-fusion protein)
MENKDEGRRKKHVTRRVIICAVILFIGWLGMTALSSLKKAPAEAKPEERALKVQAVTAEPQDYPVVITGYGEVKALTVVAIASEVAGRVVHTHPSLQVGEIIPKGDTMFEIDPADYNAALQEARAGVSQWETTVTRLKKQMAIDTERLKTLKRNAQLTKSEYDRVKGLYDADRVGTRSGVDQAERAFNSASDQADQMAQAVSIYPLQIREAESSLLSAKARLSVAETNRSRCAVRASFDARIKSTAIEIDEFISPGQQVLTLADDTVLEIEVPLDSRDARKYLQFEESDRNQASTAWFAPLTPVSCTIRWTEDKTGSTWPGTLHRVVKFDKQTRTLTVAIQIPAASAKATSGPHAATGRGDVLHGRDSRAQPSPGLPTAPACSYFRKRSLSDQ